MPFGYKAWWHRPYFMCPQDVARGREAVVMVRNPWDFYVSYWAYKGNRTTLRPLYGDGKFETFLRNLLDGDSREVFHLPQKIQLPIAQVIKERELGLLSLYYCYMTSTEDPRNMLISNTKFDITKFKTSVKAYKSELLSSDFSKIFNLSSSDHKVFAKLKRENQSSRTKNYRVYYTPELQNLVAERDRYMIEKFNYSFEGL